MNLQEIKTLFEKSGIKIAYHHFETPQKLPYGIFYSPSADVLTADCVNYFTQLEIVAEIYTSKKDPATESAFENVITAAEIPFSKSESYIESEKTYQITYEMRL